MNIGISILLSIITSWAQYVVFKQIYDPFAKEKTIYPSQSFIARTIRSLCSNLVMALTVNIIIFMSTLAFLFVTWSFYLWVLVMIKSISLPDYLFCVWLSELYWIFIAGTLSFIGFVRIYPTLLNWVYGHTPDRSTINTDKKFHEDWMIQTTLPAIGVFFAIYCGLQNYCLFTEKHLEFNSPFTMRSATYLYSDITRISDVYEVHEGSNVKFSDYRYILFSDGTRWCTHMDYGLHGPESICPILDYVTKRSGVIVQKSNKHSKHKGHFFPHHSLE